MEKEELWVEMYNLEQALPRQTDHFTSRSGQQLDNPRNSKPASIGSEQDNPRNSKPSSTGTDCYCPLHLTKGFRYKHLLENCIFIKDAIARAKQLHATPTFPATIQQSLQKSDNRPDGAAFLIDSDSGSYLNPNPILDHSNYLSNDHDPGPTT